MHSRTTLHLQPKAMRLPSDFQVKRPLGSLSDCITGNCEKSLAIMIVIASATDASGFTQTGGLLADLRRLIWCAGSALWTTVASGASRPASPFVEAILRSYAA